MTAAPADAPGDARRDAPAFHRNRDAILDALRAYLDDKAGEVLEIGAGTGQHAAAYAAAFPQTTWRPTDPDPENRASIDAWAAQAGLANLRPAEDLDAAAEVWPIAVPAKGFAAIFCANVIHISPWETACGLFAGAGRHLAPDGRLILYGPFMRDGRHTAPSNQAFDGWLKNRDPRFGVRALEAVDALAAAAGLRRDAIVEMPANNLTVIYSRR